MPPRQASAQKNKVAAKVLLIVFGILVVLSAFAAAALLLVIGAFASDSGTASTLGDLLLGSILFLPWAAILAFFVWSWNLYRKQKYTDSMIVSGVFIALNILAPVQYLLRQHQSATTDAQQATIPSGFLIPTELSIPSGFQEQQHLFTSNDYDILYMSSSTPDARLSISEGRGGTSSYSFQLQSHDIPLPDSFEQDFTFDQAPGEIFASDSVNPKGLASYDLVWDDNGNAVEVTLTDVPEGEYSTSTVMSILRSLIRSN